MSKIGAFVGIDPGKHGAMALLESNLKNYQIADFKNLERSAINLKTWNDEFEIYMAALELPQFFGGDGRISVRNLMRNVGQYEGILEALSIRFIVVSPSAWKRTFRQLPVKDPKVKAIQYCIMQFPGSVSFLKRKKDADRAEALLLADYAKDWCKSEPGQIPVK